MNKVTVITGASSGIGAALARQLGSKGHHLVLAARREDELNRVAKDTGTKTLVVKADVTSRHDVEHICDLALQEFGHVDVWVNNAGRGITKPVMELTDREVDEIVAVVLKSVLYGAQTIIPLFQEQRQGHLINISSFLGRVPLASYRSIYSAAKAAGNVFTANLRMDLKTEYPGIHVSLVIPGLVDTEFHKVASTPSFVGPGGRTGRVMIQSAKEVASQIAALIEHPVAELYTNPSSAGQVQQYYQDVGRFEENMTI